MKKHTRVVALALLALVATAACDSSDDPTPVVVDQQFFETTLEDSVIPLLDSLTMIMGPGGAKSTGLLERAEKGGACESQSCTQGGSIEACVTGFGETIDLRLTFQSCTNEGTFLNGTVDMSASEAQTTLTCNLTADDAHLSGSITATQEGECQRIMMNGFTVSGPAVNATTSSNLLYCATQYPDGTLTQTFELPGSGTHQFDIVVSSDGQASVDVSNADGDVATCAVDLINRVFTCQMIDQGEDVL